MAVVLIMGSTVFLWNTDLVLFPADHTATVLLLNDSDPDFRTPPFEDTVIAFPPKGKPLIGILFAILPQCPGTFPN
ncbi:MAG: hypothetical protein FJ403_02875 [Verrucomicrobia bacterium]|nr:hypothetical protein [Verrucomicrobiota bacterium]